VETPNARGVDRGIVVRAALTHLAVFAGYVAASVAMTWPLAVRMGDHVVAAKWHHDAYTNTMILATRVLSALGQGAGGQYENFFFAPIPQTIVFNENLFGLSLLYAPFYLASHNPLLAYNQLLILSLALSGYGAYLLVAHVSGSRSAAFVSGLAFAFCPYAAFELGRIQLVATAAIPLSLLCLQLAIERGRARYSLLFALCYAMQVGTCLYYAMFLLPIMGVLAIWLVIRHRRRELRFWLATALSGVVCAALVVAMIGPYFATRDDFALKRSESFARRYDGELSFLANVHTDNRLLNPLRHASKDEGALEEIAFPTFTMTLLALLAIAAPLLSGYRRRRDQASDETAVTDTRAAVIAFASISLLTCGTAIGVSILARSALAAVPVIAIGVAYFRWGSGGTRVLPPTITLYGALLVFSIVLFLGLEPLAVNGASMHGLYYYLHTYVPGFNGIRKVSRQAIIVMMMVAVVGGCGAAEIFKLWSSRRLLLSVALSVGLLLEVACVPMRLTRVPAGKTVPAVYSWLAKQTSTAPIAVLPAETGIRTFRGNPGLAMHNYLTVYHRHRTINGKSSWIPPVTHLFHRVARTFPTPAAKRLLQVLGVEHVAIHGGDIAPKTRGAMLGELARHPDDYEQVFRDGLDFVYRIKDGAEPRPKLLDSPQLPAGAEQVHRWNVKATASRSSETVQLALDDRFSTGWSTTAPQVAGDYLELRIPRAAKVCALELVTPDAAFELPAAYEVAVAIGDGPLTTVVRQPSLEVFRDQVLHPRAFVFRVTLPEAVVADRVRITLLDVFPATPWTVNEARVWVLP